MKSERFLFPYCRNNSPEILLLFKDSPPAPHGESDESEKKCPQVPHFAEV